MKKLFVILLIFGLYAVPLISQADCESMNSFDSKFDIPRRCLKRVDKISYGGIVDGTLELTFLVQMSNVEISIYKDGMAVIDDKMSVVPGLTKAYDLSDYGEGKYTIEVYDNGTEILSSSEEI